MLNEEIVVLTRKKYSITIIKPGIYEYCVYTFGNNLSIQKFFVKYRLIILGVKIYINVNNASISVCFVLP